MGNAQMTDAQRKKARAIRDLRRKVADRNNVAVGWVDSEGKVDPKAPQLPKRRERDG